MSVERMREEFEAWYLDKFCGGQARLFRCVNADQIYYFAEVQSRWDAWQASRAAIQSAEQPAPGSVVLPERMLGDDGVCTESHYASGWNACLDELKRLNTK